MRTVALIAVTALFVSCIGGRPGTAATSRSPTVGKATNLGPPINSQDFDGGPSVSADGRSLYFVSDREVTSGGDIWVARRNPTGEAFGNPENLGSPVNSSTDEGSPSISADGLELFFDRAPEGRIFVATRPSTSAPFGEPVAINLARSDCCDGFPDISADGLELYFCSDRPGGSGGDDVWIATRATRSSAFATPANLGPVLNSSASDCEPSISRDGLSLFIGSDRKGGHGGFDIWVATRASRAEAFGKPTNLGSNVNSGFADERPDISADGSTLYFMSDRQGGTGSFDIWEGKVGST